MAVTAAGTNVYIADTSNCLVRSNITGGNINTFAGLRIERHLHVAATRETAGPRPARNSTHPYGVAVDSKGSVYIADTSTYTVRKVTSGMITTIAGIGGIAGYSGDGGPATNAQLYNP